MNYRPSAQIREMHDDARCPDMCPICAQIEAYQDSRDVDNRDYLIQNYPEGWRDA